MALSVPKKLLSVSKHVIKNFFKGKSITFITRMSTIYILISINWPKFLPDTVFLTGHHYLPPNIPNFYWNIVPVTGLWQFICVLWFFLPLWKFSIAMAFPVKSAPRNSLKRLSWTNILRSIAWKSHIRVVTVTGNLAWENI